MNIKSERCFNNTFRLTVVSPKSLLALILISFLFIGCEQSEQPLSSRESLLSNGIQILTIDGCQYIKATDGYGHTASVSIIHKANCPNHGDTMETK